MAQAALEPVVWVSPLHLDLICVYIHIHVIAVKCSKQQWHCSALCQLQKWWRIVSGIPQMLWDPVGALPMSRSNDNYLCAERDDAWSAWFQVEQRAPYAIAGRCNMMISPDILQLSSHVLHSGQLPLAAHT